LKKEAKTFLYKSVAFAADDFGLSCSVNEAIELAHRKGVLTRTSLMVGAPFAADAVERAHRNPNLNVGLHVVLVDGNAILSPDELPDLLDANRRFGNDQVRRGFRYFFRPRVRRQLAAEIEAQFEAFAKSGLPLRHADAHKHMQLHPTVAGLMIRIGRRFGLPALRVPAEPTHTISACGTTPTLGARGLYQWTRVLRAQVRKAGLATDDHVFGLAWSGHMVRDRIRTLLAHLPPGRSEIYFHPATRRDPPLPALMPGYDHVGELQALLDPELPKIMAANGISASR